MSARRAHERLGDLAAALGDGGFAALSTPQLVAQLDLLGEVKRLVDGLGVEAAIEIEKRTVLPTGHSMAQAFGSKSAADVLGERVGISQSEASSWCRIARAVEPGMSLTGEPLAPKFPAVAAAVESGSIAIASAEVIVSSVDEVRPFLSPQDALALEASLVGQVPDFSRREFQKLCRRFPESLMPEGVEFREALQRARAGLRIRQLDNGMTRLTADLHPEAAGFVLTALDARTAPRRTPSFEDGLSEPADRDPRSLDQRRHDALADMARDSLAHDHGQIAGTAVTMMITVSLDALLTGLGTAEIAGIDETISASTARRLAADAEIIPSVLGGTSEVLDQGRAFRLYTEAQRRAMSIRDGGCVWTGCTAPPGWCEVAHLVSWLDGGPTDLANGVLLCPFHHRRFDHDDWQLEWQKGELWLIPPPHVDASRTPRPAGRRELVVR